MENAILLGLGLIGVGVLLIVLEAFLPSGGLLTVGSVASAVGGVVVLFRHDTTWGIAGLLATVVLMPLAFFYAVNVLPDTPFGRRLIGAPDEEQIAAERAREQAEHEARAALVGMEGVAVSTLRPGGTVLVDGQRLEAMSELGVVEPGQRVRVTGADPWIVRVRPIA